MIRGYDYYELIVYQHIYLSWSWNKERQCQSWLKEMKINNSLMTMMVKY